MTDPASGFSIHVPVLLNESLKLMDMRPGLVVVDGTLGAAGHAKEFLKRIGPGGFLLGLDRDPQVAGLAVRELISAGYTREEQFDVEVRRYSQFDEALAARRIPHFDRLFLDLGVCSLHLDVAERGFSLKREGLLDMRMNPQEFGTRSAADLVNEAGEAELASIFEKYGEERFARRVARFIVDARRSEPIRTTTGLREIVAAAIPRKAWPPKMDPATRVFQALRISINRELDELEALLAKLPEAMKPGSIVGIISFHSLEDRLVKRAFAKLSRVCVCPPELPVCMCGGVAHYRTASAGPAVASLGEVAVNPRSRSAKLRVLVRQ